MKTLFAQPKQPLVQSSSNDEPWEASMTIGLSMTNRAACLCCSHILLRHIRQEALYWRCSYCHQEMPASQP